MSQYSSAQSPQCQLEAMATELNKITEQVVTNTTQGMGQTADAIAQHPVTQWVARIPGADRLLTFLGQVDATRIETEVTAIQQKYPLDSARQIAERVIQQAALRAGTVGLLTNLVPPLALALFAVDLAAMTRIQAEMVYGIAAAYGFPLTDATRRGEVLAIFGLSMVGAGVLKTGASLIELLPLIGAASGAVVNATLLFGLGQTACQFYESKRHNDKAIVVYETTHTNP